jgi:hypothetical protein
LKSRPNLKGCSAKDGDEEEIKGEKKKEICCSFITAINVRK